MFPDCFRKGEKTMKSIRSILALVLMSLCTIAFAQTEAQTSDVKKAVAEASKSDAHMDHSQKAAAPKSESEKSFDTMKNLAGTWEGVVKVTPPVPEMDGQNSVITMHVTSRGNALVHEMKAAGVADDPAKYDHPLTMFYEDGGRLLLTHYCDAGNRPRMVARTSPDGKTVEFDFIDVAGSTKYGNMYHAVFTTIDANHHTEDWTYMLPGDKAMRAHFDLTRAK
jgi:hypothetical protein